MHLIRRTLASKARAPVGSQSTQPHFKQSSTYHPLRPTYIINKRRVGFCMEKGGIEGQGSRERDLLSRQVLRQRGLRQGLCQWESLRQHTGDVQGARRHRRLRASGPPRRNNSVAAAGAWSIEKSTGWTSRTTWPDPRSSRRAGWTTFTSSVSTPPTVAAWTWRRSPT